MVWWVGKTEKVGNERTNSIIDKIRGGGVS